MNGKNTQEKVAINGDMTIGTILKFHCTIQRRKSSISKHMKIEIPRQVAVYRILSLRFKIKLLSMEWKPFPSI